MSESETTPMWQGDPAEERAPVQVDLYGIKARVALGQVEEAHPRTWKEVGRHVNDRLRRIATGSFDLACEAITAVRRFIVGTSAIPGALVERIERAHDKGDRIEGKKQYRIESGQSTAQTDADVDDALENILLELRGKGLHVGLVLVGQKGEEQWVIVAVRPELAGIAEELAREALETSQPVSALPGLPSSPPTAPDETPL